MIYFDRFLSEVGIGSFSSLRFEKEWYCKNPASEACLKKVQLTEMSQAKLGENREAPTIGEAAMVRAMFAHGVQSEWLQRFYELAEVAKFYLFEPLPQASTSFNENESSVETGEWNLPFQTCAFEIRGQTLEGATLSILIHERMPNEFDFFKISRSRSRNRMIAEYVESEVQSLEPQIMLKLRQLINRLSLESNGVDQVDVREKIGTGDARKRVGLRHLIHVSPRDSIDEVTPLGRKPIDWGHAGA